MIAHVADVVAATRLPVNADFQNGYADDTEGVAENVTSCVRAGVAGLSIEDATADGGSPLYSREVAVERVRAARAAIEATGSGVFLTARCEAWLVKDPTPLRTAVDRLVAFADAGADCLSAPGVRNPADIAALVKAVAPKPVNVLVSAPSADLSLAKLVDLGVARVSLGFALARVAWGAFLRAARQLTESGEFGGLKDAASFAELNEMFSAVRP